MRVLIASVTNRAPDVLKPHLDSILALELPPRVSVAYAYISDAAPQASLELLHAVPGMDVADAAPKVSGEVYNVTETTHDWNVATFGWLAREKQRLLDYAVEQQFDAIFLVDSDLVLGPETLSSLLATGKDIVSAVFYTAWQPSTPALPQVWLSHPYDFQGRSGLIWLEPHEFLQHLSERRLMEVGGLGACTLIRVGALTRGVGFWPPVEGLPQGGMWQGEDRHFCVRAARAHVSLWADAWPNVEHLYRPSDVARLPQALETRPQRLLRASWGDSVSAILEPLEEAELARVGFKHHLRGRVGQMRLLPEIEAALLSTDVGDERIVKVRFPPWHPVEHLRDATRAILVRVLDAKHGAPDVRS